MFLQQLFWTLLIATTTCLQAADTATYNGDTRLLGSAVAAGTAATALTAAKVGATKLAVGSVAVPTVIGPALAAKPALLAPVLGAGPALLGPALGAVPALLGTGSALGAPFLGAGGFNLPGVQGTMPVPGVFPPQFQQGTQFFPQGQQQFFQTPQLGLPQFQQQFFQQPQQQFFQQPQQFYQQPQQQFYYQQPQQQFYYQQPQQQYYYQQPQQQYYYDQQYYQVPLPGIFPPFGSNGVTEVPAIQDDFGNWYYQDIGANGQYQYFLIPPNMIVRASQEQVMSKKALEETPGLAQASFKPMKTGIVTVKAPEAPSGVPASKPIMPVGGTLVPTTVKTVKMT